MSHKRRPTLIGGLLWTGLGAVFLLSNFGIGPGVWTMAGRYWPILLILLGLGKVIDYFRQKEGVSLRVGEVLGILFLLVAGSAVTRIHRHFPRGPFPPFPIGIGEPKVPIDEFLGVSYTFSQEAAYPLPSPVPLRIDNAYGNIAVTQGSDREIKVRLSKKVYQDEESQAKKIADEIRLEGGTDAGTFVVKTNREALASRDYRFRTDMEVSVPRKSQIQVRTSFGEVRVTNVTGKFNLSTTNRQLDIRDCTGDVEASNRYGEARIINLTGNLNIEARGGPVYLETIKGDVAVRNEYSPVEIKSVEGRVSISNTENKIDLEEISKPVVIDARGGQIAVRNLKESLKITASHCRRLQVSDVASTVVLNSGYSSPSLQNIKGHVEIDSKSDQLSLEGLQGSLKIRGEGSSVRVNTVAGPVDIVTTHKDVIVNDFGSSCKVTNEYGDVTLSTRGRLKGDVSVKNRNGDIDVFLPQDASFFVDAAARKGRAESDFEGIVPAEATGDLELLKGKVNAGGPRIVLETEYNKIRLRKQGGEVSKSTGN